MLRNGARLVRGLSQFHAPLHKQPVFRQGSLGLCRLAPCYRQVRTLRCSSAHPDLRKDFALPNSSWKKDMMDMYSKYMELVKSGAWKRLPSYNVTVLHLPEEEPSTARSTRLFTRNLDVEGNGFEYAMFQNVQEKRTVCLFQPGPYLEGPPSFTHGGCIATIIDSVTGMCAIYAAGRVMTANLNINYKNPIPLGSVVVVESQVDNIEGRKVFLSCRVRSADNTILHTEATGDAGYPLKPWLLTPYRNPPNQASINYNRAHIKTRNTIERAFGLLKDRFRCLDRTGGWGGALMYNPSKVCDITIMCMMFHNFAVLRHIPLPEDTTPADAMPDPDEHEDNVEESNEGILVRDKLAHIFLN